MNMHYNLPVMPTTKSILYLQLIVGFGFTVGAIITTIGFAGLLFMQPQITDYEALKFDVNQAQLNETRKQFYFDELLEIKTDLQKSIQDWEGLVVKGFVIITGTTVGGAIGISKLK